MERIIFLLAVMKAREPMKTMVFTIYDYHYLDYSRTIIEERKPYIPFGKGHISTCFMLSLLLAIETTQYIDCIRTTTPKKKTNCMQRVLG